MSDSIGRTGRRSGAHSLPAASEGRIAADRDGLARLVLELGDEVKVCLEMMSGALWVRDQLVDCGWQVEVADARIISGQARTRTMKSSSLTAASDRSEAGWPASPRRRPRRRAQRPRGHHQRHPGPIPSIHAEHYGLPWLPDESIPHHGSRASANGTYPPGVITDLPLQQPSVTRHRSPRSRRGRPA
jgi:hypothetical protein